MPAIFKTLDKVKPFYDAADRVVMFICKILLIADVLITTIAVLSRRVPFVPATPWSEEIVLMFMAYMAFLSASLAIRRGSHIRMTAFDPYINKKILITLDVLADLAVMAFAVIMVVVGWKYCNGIGAKGFYTSMPWLSKFWQYVPIPFAGLAMIIFQLESFYQHIRSFFVKGVEKA